MVKPGATRLTILGAVVFVTGLTGCRSHSAPQSVAPSGRGAQEVIVASFNFPESELLAEIYAEALQHAGIPVRRELDLGPREMVLPALHQGLVDVVPEYLGSAVAALEPSKPSSSLSGTNAATLAAELASDLAPWHVRPLDWAAAADQNGLAVTRDTASRLALHKVSDLEAFASTLTLAGPTECPNRPLCLPGFQSRYGLTFKGFAGYDAESQRVSALEERLADVAVMFTTDGQLATGDPVLLADDRHLQPAENVVPIVSERALAAYGSRLRDAINRVSSRLSTDSLLFLNWRVSVANRPIPAEASGWLQREALVPRPS